MHLDHSISGPPALLGARIWSRPCTCSCRFRAWHFTLGAHALCGLRISEGGTTCDLNSHGPRSSSISIFLPSLAHSHDHRPGLHGGRASCSHWLAGHPATPAVCTATSPTRDSGQLRRDVPLPHQAPPFPTSSRLLHFERHMLALLRVTRLDVRSVLSSSPIRFVSAANGIFVRPSSSHCLAGTSHSPSQLPPFQIPAKPNLNPIRLQPNSLASPPAPSTGPSLICPSRYALARRIIPAQYLPHPPGYKTILPNFPANQYPVLLSFFPPPPTLAAAEPFSGAIRELMSKVR